MKGYSNRYRIRVGNYRIGIEVNSNKIEMMRVLSLFSLELELLNFGLLYIRY